MACDVLGKDVGGHAPFLRPSDVPVPDESILAEYQFSFPSRPIRQTGMCWTCYVFFFDICWFLVSVWSFIHDGVGMQNWHAGFCGIRLIVALLSEIMGGECDTMLSAAAQQAVFLTLGLVVHVWIFRVLLAEFIC